MASKTHIWCISGFVLKIGYYMLKPRTEQQYLPNLIHRKLTKTEACTMDHSPNCLASSPCVVGNCGSPETRRFSGIKPPDCISYCSSARRFQFNGGSDSNHPSAILCKHGKNPSSRRDNGKDECFILLDILGFFLYLSKLHQSDGDVKSSMTLGHSGPI